MNATRNPLTIETFLETLSELYGTGHWQSWIGEADLSGIIRLRRDGGHTCYSPLTAVYCHLTGGEIQNCFWLPEVSSELGLVWWEVLEIQYASDRCEGGRRYDRNLRDEILGILELPMEKPIPTDSY
jgi:hypothetical protein